MANEKEEPVKKVRRPKPLKRDEQNEKKRMHNRACKARMLTAIRSLESAISKKETASIAEKLQAVHSLADKGVKTGLYKLNQASRLKARFTKAVRSV